MFMKYPSSVLATAISVVLLLAGCGGGGGSVDNKPMLPLLDNWQRFEAGNPTLRMSSAQIRQAYDSRSKRASHDLTITRFVGPGGESILLESIHTNMKTGRCPRAAPSHSLRCWNTRAFASLK